MMHDAQAVNAQKKYPSHILLLETDVTPLINSVMI